MPSVGIYGGTFDPIHRGHVDAVEEARRNVGLEAVVYVPAFQAPHKTDANAAPAFHRFAMAALALAQHDALLLSEYEVAQGKPVFTVDTMRHFREALAPAEAVLVIGSDSLAALATWRAWREIFAENRIAVVYREPWTYTVTRDALPMELRGLFQPEGARLDAAPPKNGVFWGGNAPVTISSTWVRSAVREGKDPGAALPLDVERYLRKHALYAPEPRPAPLSTS